MRKNTIIEILSRIPGNPEVCVVDLVSHAKADPGDGEGTSEGIHPEYDIFLMGHKFLVGDCKPFVAICFNTGTDLELADGLRPMHPRDHQAKSSTPDLPDDLEERMVGRRTLTEDDYSERPYKTSRR